MSHIPGRHEVCGMQATGRQAEVPPMPSIPQGSLWYSPNLVYVPKGRHTIGWQNTRKEGHCFVVARTSVMGEKVLERFPLTQDGWARAWASLVRLDPGAAAAVALELERKKAAYADRAAKAERRAKMQRFRALGVEVQTEAAEVRTIGGYDSRGREVVPRLLGLLAGAQAVVTDGSQAWSPGRAMFMPIGLTGLATKTKADAVIVFADGTTHTTALDGNAAVREAQKQAVQFNALAGASAPAAAVSADDPAAKLRKLQELRDAGLLTQGEYEMKRAEVIDSI
jgi:Short C-terminal domain